MEGLKDPFIRIRIPGLPGCHVNAFYPLPFGSLHGPLEKEAHFFDAMFGLRSHPIGKPFVKHPFPHIYKLVFDRHFVGLKDFQNGFHDLGTNAIPLGNCYLHIDNFRFR